MKTRYTLVAIITVVVMLSAFAFSSCIAQERQPAEKDKTHSNSDCDAMHMDEMNKRGEREMGFSQTTTLHHFRILSDGGAIEVEAKNANDTVSANQIIGHLTHIAQMFSEGNFNTPMLIHGKMPPGVPVMQQLKAEIEYKFEKTDRGGRIRIKTRNVEALKAIHEFFRFQITEHGTGDSLEIGERI